MLTPMAHGSAIRFALRRAIATAIRPAFLFGHSPVNRLNSKANKKSLQTDSFTVEF